jgi:hypothetical protein
MPIINDQLSTSASYPCAVDFPAVQSRLDALIDEIVASTFSEVQLGQALTSGMTSVGTIVRAVPVAEGRLLERAIALVASLNPDLVVLTTNLRLPVTKAAAELVERNDPALFRALSLDSDSGGRKSYTPDLIILNRRTDVAHLVDVKRSLNSYEVSRIAELKSRMLAAALVVPDLLYREHRRLHAKEVRVVILNAENQRSDIDGGVWPLSHLDHLLEVSGAGEMINGLRHLFQLRIEDNWVAALKKHAAANADASAGSVGTRRSEPVADDVLPPAEPERKAVAAAAAPQSMLRIGFARPPGVAPH